MWAKTNKCRLYLSSESLILANELLKLKKYCLVLHQSVHRILPSLCFEASIADLLVLHRKVIAVATFR